MAVRATQDYTLSNWIVNLEMLVRDTGFQIDWANVGAGYVNATTGKKIIKASTIMGILLHGSKLSPRALTTNPAFCILLTDATEGSKSDAISGYGVARGGYFFENLMADATGGPPKTLAAAFKTELAANSPGLWLWKTFIETR